MDKRLKLINIDGNKWSDIILVEIEMDVID